MIPHVKNQIDDDDNAQLLRDLTLRHSSARERIRWLLLKYSEGTRAADKALKLGMLSEVAERVTGDTGVPTTDSMMPRGVAMQLWKEVIERITAIEPSAVPLSPVKELDCHLPECHIPTNVQKIERARHYVSHLSKPIPAERVPKVVFPNLTREFFLTTLVYGTLEDMFLDDIAERAKKDERSLKIIDCPKIISKDPPASGTRGKELVTSTICGKTGHNASRCWNISKKSSGSTSVARATVSRQNRTGRRLHGLF